MNNTDKAKYEAAKKMLAGRIEEEEVAMLLELPIEEIRKAKEEVEDKFRKVYGDMKIYDMNNGQVLYDDFNDDGMNGNSDLLDRSEEEE